MIQCTICPVIKSAVLRYITDTKKILTPEFITNRYHLHLTYSFVLSFFAVWFLINSADLGRTPFLFQLFIGGFGAYGVNFVREWYYGIKYKAPWDWTDLNFGSYGGVLGALLATLIF